MLRTDYRPSVATNNSARVSQAKFTFAISFFKFEHFPGRRKKKAEAYRKKIDEKIVKSCCGLAAEIIFLRQAFITRTVTPVPLIGL